MRIVNKLTDRLLTRMLAGGTASANTKVCVVDSKDPSCEICTVYDENGKPIFVERVCFGTTNGTTKP